MAIDYINVGDERFVALLPSAAYTATPDQKQLNFTEDIDAIVLVVNATSVAASGSVTPKIEGVDPETGATYPILTATGTAIVDTTNTAVTYAYRVGQSLPGGVDGTNKQSQSANDIVPPTVRITFTHADSTNSFTYSATLLIPD